MMENRNMKFVCLGIGGAGMNMCASLEKENLENLQIFAINTDKQQMDKSPIKNKILIGESITKGFGCGGDPEIGKQCAIADLDKLSYIFDNADIAFITCGMGGGTGTGASSEIAKLAKSKNCLVISIVTTPFKFEGDTRRKKAQFGIVELNKYTDNIVIISNDNIMFSMGESSLNDSFRASDAVLVDSIKTILSVLKTTGVLNLDFADIKHSMENKKLTMINKSHAKGKNKIIEAAKLCSYNPLLEYSIKNAQTIILNVKGSSDISLDDVDKCVTYFKNISKTKLDVIFGFELDDNLKDEINLYLIATDYVKIDDNSQDIELSRVNANVNLHSNIDEQISEDDDLLDIVPEFLKAIKMENK